MIEIEREWTTSAGLRARCVLTDMGHRCGYVLIDEPHPLVNVGYSDESPALAACAERREQEPVGGIAASPILLFTMAAGVKPRPDHVFDVHGGITFAGKLRDAPEPWAFGFDCMHLDDTPDRCTEAFVVAECEKLATQLAEVAP